MQDDGIEYRTMNGRSYDGATLDELLDELTDLAASAPPASKFFRAILDAAIKGTDASAGAIWSVVNTNYRLEQEAGLIRIGIGSDQTLQSLHEDALEEASRPTREAQSVSEGDVTARRHEGMVFRFYGCRDQLTANLIIELVHASDATIDPTLIARMLAALSEIARDYRNAQTLQRLQMHDHIWNEFNSVLPVIYSSIRLSETAFHIANEGRAFLQCDRVAVVRFEEAKAHVLAVSGIATLEHRAKQLRTLESLVTRLCRTGTALRFPDRTHPDSSHNAPEHADSLQQYLDESGCQQIWIRPLFRGRDDADSGNRVVSPQDRLGLHSESCIGALVFESFQATSINDLEPRADLLLQHSELALRNALSHEQLPLRQLGLAVQSLPAFFRSYRWKIVATALTCAALIGVAIVVPADLNIDAKGTIQPASLQHLYAPANGEVVRILASHQQEVRPGDVMIEIRSRETELRKEELLTQRATTQEKLRGIEVARLRDRKPSTAEPINLSELSANERELREVLHSQDEQLAILNEILASLQIKSPIRGQVISWDPSESLEGRPVQMGQKLISVADDDGIGKLQLRVLDADSRHVIRAAEQLGVPVNVTFSIASDPGIRHSAVVDQIGSAVETTNADGPTLRVGATVAASEMLNARPGATVAAKIHCGRASIGYVWTRRLLEYLQLRFL